MTQEEKQPLLKDLCARLLHGVICFAPDYEYGDIGKLWCIEPLEDLDPPITIQYPKGNVVAKFCSEVKPYLRPMSSMTEEERNNLRAYCRTQEGIIYDIGVLGAINSLAIIDWLNAHHFDYRGLIEKGLALEAPEGMYEY